MVSTASLLVLNKMQSVWVFAGNNQQATGTTYQPLTLYLEMCSPRSLVAGVDPVLEAWIQLQVCTDLFDTAVDLANAQPGVSGGFT